MIRTISQYIQNRSCQCEVWKSPLPLPVYRKIVENIYSSSNPEYIFPRTPLPWNGVTVALTTMQTILTIEILFDKFIFYIAIKINKECFIAHIGMCNPPPKIQWFAQWMHWQCILLDPHNIMRDGIFLPVSYQYRLVPSQDIHSFYTRSRLSALQSCALIFSTNFQFIFTFK